jgi:hypothetical protein
MEIFAPIVKWEIIRTLATIAMHNVWCIKHFDVQTTFLHGFLNEEVFMFQLEGLIVLGQE